MIDRQWLHRWAMTCRAATLMEFSDPNTCILTTRLGIDVLKHFGVNARPQPVRVVAYNRAGATLAMRKVPISQWPDDAWAVGIEGTGVSSFNGRLGWDGHLVVVVRNPERTRTLIDLTADQLSRSQRGIDIGGPVMMDLPPVWAPGDMRYVPVGEADTAFVSYEPQANVGDWQQAPDWSSNDEVHEVLVKSVIESLEAE